MQSKKTRHRNWPRRRTLSVKPLRNLRFTFSYETPILINAQEEEDEKKKKLAADKKTGSGLPGAGKNEAVVDELISNITSGTYQPNRARRPTTSLTSF